MYESQRAFVIAENHELNLFRKKKKHGNKWFYGTGEHFFQKMIPTTRTLSITKHLPAVCTPKTNETRSSKIFQTLPIALEREDIRIVHACWDEKSIQTLRGGNQNLIERHNELKKNSQPRHHQNSPSLKMKNQHQKKLLTSKTENSFYKTIIP